MLELLVGILVGVLVTTATWGISDTVWKLDAVHRGLAIYCPTDGHWAWVGECGK